MATTNFTFEAFFTSNLISGTIEGSRFISVLDDSFDANAEFNALQNDPGPQRQSLNDPVEGASNLTVDGGVITLTFTRQVGPLPTDIITFQEQFFFLVEENAGFGTGAWLIPAVGVDNSQVQPGDVISGTSGLEQPFFPYPPCFVAGTMIETPEGPRPVEALKAGDLVTTADRGAQPVRLVARRTLGPAELALHPSVRPIRFEAGALGPNQPARTLRVSPQHRMLVAGWRAELLFGEPEVLVPAKSLVNDRTIRVEHTEDAVIYVHLVFDRHEIVFAEGAASESFQPGPEAIAGLAKAARRELLLLFPEFATGLPDLPAARPALRCSEGAILGARLG